MGTKKNSTKFQTRAGVDLSKILQLMRWAGLWEPAQSSRLLKSPLQLLHLDKRGNNVNFHSPAVPYFLP